MADRKLETAETPSGCRICSDFKHHVQSGYCPLCTAGICDDCIFKLLCDCNVSGSVSSSLFVAGDKRRKSSGWPQKRKDGEKEVSPDISLRQGRIPQKELRRLSRKTALKAYFLQNSYNYGNYEGVAYAEILYPALKQMCRNEEELRQESRDSMGYCSVNPNFLPILTSFHLALFQKGMSARDTRDVRLALMGPLAGIGDSLVQFCFAPIFSTIGASMAQNEMIAGPIVFLLGMNGLLLGLKRLNEELGFRLSTSLADKMKDYLGPISRGARMVGTAIITGLVVTSVNIEWQVSHAGDGRYAASISVSSGADWDFVYLVKVRKWNMYQLVGITLAAGIILKSAGILL